MGRNQIRQCSEIRVVFHRPEPVRYGWFVLMVAVLVIAGVWMNKKPQIQTELSEDAPKTAAGLCISETELDVQNLKIRIAGNERDLTFREAKLLDYFFRHSNELLERERLLKNIWEDEGIIVDRSLDVFVSRLRKILAQDTGLRIVNVRGVGYRLEAE
ncbi:MAG: winged helix-turn-helix domain-containing protein [Bacteroidia bacterium]